jgi:hypothetical protein
VDFGIVDFFDRINRIFRINFIFHPRPPRLSPPQADDGGQAESQKEYF